mmetsp:Transcript_17738/g.24645  ORF Transcript_17738/g.24645 Transcript_17738/m.24645 type:complete len:184 (+) Transcript_17738:124-675(+)
MFSHRFILLVVLALFAFATAESDNNDSNLFSYLRRRLGKPPKKPRNPNAAPKPGNAQGPKPQGPKPPKKNKNNVGFFKKECFKLDTKDACLSDTDALSCKWCDPGEKCIPASFGCCKYAVTETDCNTFDGDGEGCDWVEDECEAKDCDDILVEADCDAVIGRCIWNDADEPKCSRNKQLWRNP